MLHVTMTEIYISENILEKDDLIRPQETNFRIYMYVCVCVCLHLHLHLQKSTLRRLLCYCFLKCKVFRHHGSFTLFYFFLELYFYIEIRNSMDMPTC